MTARLSKENLWKALHCKSCGKAPPLGEDVTTKEQGDVMWREGWDCNISTGFRCPACK